MDMYSTQLQWFFELATERKLSGNDQLVYLHILNLFQRARWTETLRIKDAELQELCRLHDSSGKPASLDTIRRCKQRLKAKGFINFKSGAGSKSTQYKLTKLDDPADTPANIPAATPAENFATPVQAAKSAETDSTTPADTPADTPVDTPADSQKKFLGLGLVCYTQKREHAGEYAHKSLNNSKVLCKKSIEEEEEDAGAQMSAGDNCESENRNEKPEIAENPAPPTNDLRESDAGEIWAQATGYRLSDFLEKHLRALDHKYGRESFIVALTQAVSAKEDEARQTGKKMFVNFNYFTAVLRSLKKEGEKIEKQSTTRTTQPNQRPNQRATQTAQQNQRSIKPKYEVPDYSKYPF